MATPRPTSRSTKFGAFMEGRAPVLAAVKRWDGAARTCFDWDGLRRDPQLWFRNGNCLIYLHGKGRSRRGPSFKVPFAALLTAKCYPLIERFLVAAGPMPRTVRDLERWHQADPNRTIELYIPAPPRANKQQAFHYHLAARNLLAWVFRRSLVGDHLGGALVGLLHSMHEFRSRVDDNVQDMMGYLDEEGYLDLSDQPDHALGILYLAEFFQMSELYTWAFAHCVGMSELLHLSTEHEHISTISRSFIRSARSEMDARVMTASEMMRNLLDVELSETHLGIPAGTRAHLERFRGFLMSFYMTQFGYYPPLAFDSRVFRRMREDFEALYDLLVDTRYSSSETMPSVAVGGICTLQLVQSFDSIHQYEPLEHPLPLLPQFKQPGARRMSWLPRGDRLRPDQRLLAHASLIRASNWKEHIFQNDLVRAYRKFEENCVVAPNRADKPEKVSLVDARKVRWLLVYGVYQVLRSVTEEPAEVMDDDEASYHLAVSTENVPPWKKPRGMHELLRRQTDLAANLSPLEIWGNSTPELVAGKIEIKPDIDYFALTHPDPERGRRGSLPTIATNSPPPLVRSYSLTRALSRSSTIRKSMRLFKPAPAAYQVAASPPRPAYHEIVVHGYGNGTNNVNFNSEGPARDTSNWPTRTDSTTSPSESSAESAPESTPESTPESLTSASTLESPDLLKTPSTTAAVVEVPLEWEGQVVQVQRRAPQKRRDVVSMVIPSRTNSFVNRKRPMSAVIPESSSSPMLTPAAEPAAELPRQARFARTQSLRIAGRHSMIFPDLRRWSQGPEGRSGPLWMMREGDISEEPRIAPGGADDWTELQAWLDGDDEQASPVGAADSVKPSWEQYAELGGLTEMR